MAKVVTTIFSALGCFLLIAAVNAIGQQQPVDDSHSMQAQNMAKKEEQGHRDQFERDARERLRVLNERIKKLKSTGNPDTATHLDDKRVAIEEMLGQVDKVQLRDWKKSRLQIDLALNDLDKKIFSAEHSSKK